MRRSYEESFAALSEIAEIVGDPKPHVTRNPRHDDRDFGPSLLRSLLDNADLSDLTLPGLFVGRSELRRVYLAGSDLRLATFNWTDFVGCSFYRCDLSGADLRACTFEGCAFTQSDLRGADLRHSTFSACDFTGARLGGAVLLHEQKALVNLSPEQGEQVFWSDEKSEPAVV